MASYSPLPLSYPPVLLLVWILLDQRISEREVRSLPALNEEKECALLPVIVLTPANI